MSDNDLFKITRKYFTDYHQNRGSESVLLAFIADEAVYHVPGATLDSETMKSKIRELRSQLTSVRVTLSDPIQNRDRLSFKFVYEGYNESGEWTTIGPVPIRYRFADGKVVEAWMAGSVPGF